MITAKTLRAMLRQIPDESTIYAYEGEGIGLAITLPDGPEQWINARPDKAEDTQDEFNPPIYVRPHFNTITERITELEQAIDKCKEAGITTPAKWAAELGYLKAHHCNKCGRLLSGYSGGCPHCTNKETADAMAETNLKASNTPEEFFNGLND